MNYLDFYGTARKSDRARSGHRPIDWENCYSSNNGRTKNREKEIMERNLEKAAKISVQNRSILARNQLVAKE